MIPTKVYNEIRAKFTEETADFFISRFEEKPATKDDVREIVKDELKDVKENIDKVRGKINYLMGLLLAIAAGALLAIIFK